MLMNINKNINFIGYAACPLKALYLQSPSCDESRETVLKASKELEPIAKKEGFDLFIHCKGNLYNIRDKKKKKSLLQKRNVRAYAQDPAVFLQNGKIGIFKNDEFLDSVEIEEARNFAKAINKKTQNLSISTVGGNFFIGKKDNGENYLLIGDEPIIKDSLANLADWFFADEQKRKDMSKDVITKLFKETGIKTSNIYTVPQAKPDKGSALDFHIDMIVRPLKYPYILVNDPHLVVDEVEKMGVNNEKQEQYLDQLKTEQYQYLNKNMLISTDQIVKELEEQGFKPIRVPGIFWRNAANYINAVVHERPNGDLVYITNSDPIALKETGIDYDKIFKNYIKENVPSIKQVVFIKNHLLKNNGGIHCMTLEQPDFDKWT